MSGVQNDQFRSYQNNGTFIETTLQNYIALSNETSSAASRVSCSSTRTPRGNVRPSPCLVAQSGPSNEAPDMRGYSADSHCTTINEPVDPSPLSTSRAKDLGPIVSKSYIVHSDMTSRISHKHTLIWWKSIRVRIIYEWVEICCCG